VSVLASFLCEAELAAGRLVRVLPEWQGAPTLVHAIYPSTRHVSAKVRAFVDALVEAFASSPARRVS
jgi:DNA-binding transcriptional LysR family regulator